MIEQQALDILERSLVNVAEALVPLWAETQLPITLTRVARAARPAREAGLIDELVSRWQAEFAEQPADEQTRAVIGLTLGAMRGDLPSWAEQDPDLN